MASLAEEAAIRTAQERVVSDKLAVEAKVAAEARAKNRKPLEVVGRVGGAFNIRGEDFGFSGTLTIGDRVIKTDSWRDHLIKGQIPEDLAPGKIVVRSVLGEQTGMYPSPPKVAVPAPLAPALK